MQIAFENFTLPQTFKRNLCLFTAKPQIDKFLAKSDPP